MAGTVDLVQRCYTGLETREDALWLNPSLPEELDGLDFDVRYRGHWGINLHLTPQRLRVRVADSDAAPVRVAVSGEVVDLAAGQHARVPAGGPTGTGPFGPCRAAGAAGTWVQ